MTNLYEAPLLSRDASPYMLELFSADTRYRTWRRRWVSLAKHLGATGCHHLKTACHSGVGVKRKDG